MLISQCLDSRLTDGGKVVSLRACGALYSIPITSLIIIVLDISHCPVIYFRTLRFGDWILSPFSGGTYADGLISESTLSPQIKNSHFSALSTPGFESTLPPI
jgi:hypothetical protein